jgi:hypothetical protein
MRRTLIALIVAAPFVWSTATAQERPRAGRFEIGVFPVGGVFFTESSSGLEPAFGNFALGATLNFTLNRWIGIEGEVGNAIGIRQQLTWQDRALAEVRTPGLYSYNGNLVVHPFTDSHRAATYGAIGAGGMTLRDTNDAARLNQGGNSTFLVGNVGGGVKWYAHQRWGLRGDYRLLIVNDKADAPAFFGGDRVRFGHRVYGGLLFFL